MQYDWYLVILSTHAKSPAIVIAAIELSIPKLDKGNVFLGNLNFEETLCWLVV